MAVMWASSTVMSFTLNIHVPSVGSYMYYELCHTHNLHTEDEIAAVVFRWTSWFIFDLIYFTQWLVSYMELREEPGFEPSVSSVLLLHTTISASFHEWHSEPVCCCMSEGYCVCTSSWPHAFSPHLTKNKIGWDSQLNENVKKTKQNNQPLTIVEASLRRDVGFSSQLFIPRASTPATPTNFTCHSPRSPSLDSTSLLWCK